MLDHAGVGVDDDRARARPHDARDRCPGCAPARAREWRPRGRSGTMPSARLSHCASWPASLHGSRVRCSPGTPLRARCARKGRRRMRRPYRSMHGPPVSPFSCLRVSSLGRVSARGACVAPTGLGTIRCVSFLLSAGLLSRARQRPWRMRRPVAAARVSSSLLWRGREGIVGEIDRRHGRYGRRVRRGWYLGERFGFMTAFMLSMVATGVGMYLAPPHVTGLFLMALAPVHRHRWTATALNDA